MEFMDNDPRSCITNGMAHLSFFEPRTHTQFTWCGNAQCQIEVTTEYGEPVVERIPVPLSLSLATNAGLGTFADLLERFAAVCSAYVEAKV